LSVVSVACCQVEISASGWSLVHRSPTKCVCVSECAWVWSWILDNVEPLAHWGLLRRSKKKKEVFGCVLSLLHIDLQC